MTIHREDVPLLRSALAKFAALTPADFPGVSRRVLSSKQSLVNGIRTKLSLGITQYSAQEIDVLRIACDMGAFVLDGFTVQERVRLSFYEDQLDSLAASLADDV